MGQISIWDGAEIGDEGGGGAGQTLDRDINQPIHERGEALDAKGGDPVNDKENVGQYTGPGPKDALSVAE